MAVMSGTAAGETLLLIDDEKMVRESTARVLEGYGYEVMTAADGLEGLMRYEEAEQRPALVMLDLSMPDMSGLEVLKKMQAMDPDVKVLIFTGHDIEAENFPAVAGIIQKPFQLDELTRLVCQVLE